MSRTKWLVAFAVTLFAAVPAHAGGIGVNLGANWATPGNLAAGVVPEPNWNNFVTGGFAGAPLVDSTNTTVPGLTVGLNVVGIGPTGAGADVSFANPGDQGMMGGINYSGDYGYLELAFNGTLPYEYSDVYIYSHSGQVGNLPQNVSILSGGGGNLGFNKIAIDVAGTTASYVPTGNGYTPGNYVVFPRVPTSVLGSNFVVRVGDGTNSDYYSIINGVQIVESTLPADPLPAISLNFASNWANPGNAAAGVVPALYWNNFGTGGFAGEALKDSTNTTVPGVTADLSFVGSGANGAGSDSSFAIAPDQGMMGSVTYTTFAPNANGYIQLDINGTLPHDTYDVYVYAHSGQVGELPQDVRILSGAGGDLGLSQLAIDMAGTATSFVQTGDGTTPGNYVLFENVATSLLGSHFMIRIGSATSEFALLNGVQFVPVTAPVPEPSGIALASAGLIGLIGCVRRKRK
jgi:hypothetical protein